MEKLDLREKELEISHEEWKSVWMLQITRKRMSVEVFQYQALRDVVKGGGDTVVKNFGDKFRELKLEGSRKKTVETLFMGTESGARRNFHEDKEIFKEGETGGILQEDLHTTEIELGLAITTSG